MTSFSAAACVSSASEAGVRMTSRSLSWTSSSTRLVTVTGNASLPRRPFEPIRRRKRRSACSTGISSAPSSIRYSRSAARSKTAPRSAPTARTRLPDQALVDLRPRFDLLVRVDPHPGRDDALGADQDVVADRNALVDAHVRPDLAPPADDRAFDDGALAEVRRSIDDRAGDARALAEGHARLEHGVRADRSLGRDAAVVADEGRPLDALEVLDVDPLPHPDVPAQPAAGDAQAHALVERVEVRLPVLGEVADVLPVALADVAVDRSPHLEQEREELLREVVRPVGRHVAHDLRLEYVDARVDRVREDLPPRRLLEEALDAPVVVGDDDPELERIVDRLQPDRDSGALLAVEVDEPAQVDVAERVARDDEERVVEAVAREGHGAGGAERRLLDGVLDREPERLAVAEVAPDLLRQEGDGDDHVLEPMRSDELEDVLHARLADDRHHRLRLVRGQRPEARALAAGHDDGLHVCTSRRALSRYPPSEAAATATPDQKIQSGQSVPSRVTITNASDAYRSQVATLPAKLTAKS